MHDSMISICTSSTPWWPLPELLPRLAATGHQGIELAVKPHRADPAQPPNCWTNNHAVIDVDRLEHELPVLRDLLATHGMRLAAIGSYHGAQELDVHRRIARCAQALGCGIVRATFPGHDPAVGYRQQFADQRRWWRELAQVGADHGVRFCPELHDNTLIASASAAMRLLDGLPIAGCGVILDAANTVAEGNEAMPMLIDLLGPHLAHLHVKQRTLHRRNEPYLASWFDFAISPLAQAGDIPWPDIAALLKRAEYRGWWSIEDFTRMDQPMERLRDNVELIRQWR